MSKAATAKTNVVLVDAVRTPFGKAGSLYAETRADDIMVRCLRGLLERNPNVPAIESFAIQEEISQAYEPSPGSQPNS